MADGHKSLTWRIEKVTIKTGDCFMDLIYFDQGPKLTNDICNNVSWKHRQFILRDMLYSHTRE